MPEARGDLDVIDRNVIEFHHAAARGDVHHELEIGHTGPDGGRVEGSVDLLYRAADGAWHVVDYKTNRVPDEQTLRRRIAAYYPQVRAYAAALDGRVDAPVASHALWFVAAGVVARWPGGADAAA